MSRQPSNCPALRDSQYPPAYSKASPSPISTLFFLNQRGLMGTPWSAALRAARCFVSKRSFSELACVKNEALRRSQPANHRSSTAQVFGAATIADRSWAKGGACSRGQQAMLVWGVPQPHLVVLAELRVMLIRP